MNKEFIKLGEICNLVITWYFFIDKESIQGKVLIPNDKELLLGK